MEIKVEKLNPEQLKKIGVFAWPIWEKEASRFPWVYESIEECYFLKGEATVKSKDGKAVTFGEGDFVTFPKGLSCTWIIKQPVKKHYHFR